MCGAWKLVMRLPSGSGVYVDWASEGVGGATPAAKWCECKRKRKQHFVKVLFGDVSICRMCGGIVIGSVFREWPVGREL